jgi:putative ubiquitin-RnfH superfamily antitoxin RatB of RatAB toxin-antitoxin module
MSDSSEIKVEVAYALPDRQSILSVVMPAGSTVQEAIMASGIRDLYPEIDLGAQKVGIFGRLAKLDEVLRTGDRVEIYRPLKADPKEVRRRLAAEGKTMGKLRDSELSD